MAATQGNCSARKRFILLNLNIYVILKKKYELIHLKSLTGDRNISEIVCDEDTEYEDVRIGDCSGTEDGDMMVEIENEDTDEHLRIGQQQCQEALVSEGLKRAALASQDIKH